MSGFPSGNPTSRFVFLLLFLLLPAFSPDRVLCPSFCALSFVFASLLPSFSPSSTSTSLPFIFALYSLPLPSPFTLHSLFGICLIFPPSRCSHSFPALSLLLPPVFSFFRSARFFCSFLFFSVLSRSLLFSPVLSCSLPFSSILSSPPFRPLPTSPDLSSSPSSCSPEDIKKAGPKACFSEC